MPEERLKLGKGASFFVKSQLRCLDQEDDTWEADFFPIPCSDSKHGSVWWGIVLSHSHENVLAQRTVEEPPTVNDLANLLAEAMRRPLLGFSYRPRSLYFRAKPEWAELLPHLKQVGIKAVAQDTLPKWDRNFGDLQAQVEQARMVAAGKPIARTKRPAATTAAPGNFRLYTLDVFLLGSLVPKKFAKKNPAIFRTIQIRGDQTLEDLHQAIFEAFDRWDEHMYEFRFGEVPMDSQGHRYVLPSALDMDMGGKIPPVGMVNSTTIGSLGLAVGRRFAYWFDFGDDWWHQINVVAIEEKVPSGKYPKVTKKVGKSPPQYPDEEE